ncbi:MAG: ABC transporter permease [Rhodospirillales bacterium]|nr:ABC transporter permease [Rhodospirillales bacterium]
MSAAGTWAGGSGRVSLARATLVHEWRRFLPAVLAVAFSGLLVIVQLGLLLGMFATVSTIVDRSRADLWVIEGLTVSFDLARPMPARIEMHLRAHRYVETVQQLTYVWSDWRRPDGGKVTIFVVGIDVTARSLSTPTTFADGLRERLRPLGSVVIDATDADKLGVGVGDVAEINGHRVRVAGTTTGIRAVGGADVFASLATAALVSPPEHDDAASYFLIKLTDPARSEAVQAELQPQGEQPPWRILTPGQFSQASQLYWLGESGAGAGFAFSAFLALLVGVAITSQTLRGALLAQVREYAMLRALGVPTRALRAVVLEQALWVGVAGPVVTAALTAAIAFAAGAAQVAILFSWWGVATTAAFILAIAGASSWLALAPLYATQPADLLR